MSPPRQNGPSNIKDKLTKLLRRHSRHSSRSSTATSSPSLRDRTSSKSVTLNDHSYSHTEPSMLSVEESSATGRHYIDESGDDLDLHDVMSDTEESAAESDPEDHTFFHTEGDNSETVFADLPDEALRAPKYMKITRKTKKSPRVLNNLFMAQELRCAPPDNDSDSSSDTDHKHPHHTSTGDDDFESPMNPNEILAMEFSANGKYLAVAGRDCKITVWQVITSPLGRLNYQSREARDKSKKRNKSKVYPAAPVFLPEPVRVFEGHTKTILCLDWSKNNFLVSGSMDKTVKLWNVDRPDCLETFRHGDFVSAVRFHPTDDRFFVSGALDNNLRLWSILESSVAYTTHLGDNALITCLTFTPSGAHCLVGGFHGSLYGVETAGLHLIKQVEIRRKKLLTLSHSNNGQKITGIKVFENPSCAGYPDTELFKWNLLVTMNDSSVRLIDMNSRKLITRFKGSSNHKSSIAASVSDDTRYIISGSEDHWCYVWGNNNSVMNSKLRSELKQYLTDGKKQIAETQKKLGKIMNDHKLWMKLPVHTFLEDKDGQVYIANENSNYAAFHAHHNRVNFAIFAPENTTRLLKFSDDTLFDLVKRGQELSSVERKKGSKTPENPGFIIVTSDTSGVIRVFRQDPASAIRKKLIELKRSYEHDQKANGRNLNKLDLSATTSKIMRTRSMSPNLDRTQSSKLRMAGMSKSSLKQTPHGMESPQSSSHQHSSVTLTPGLLSPGNDERLSYFAQSPTRTSTFSTRTPYLAPSRSDTRLGSSRSKSKGEGSDGRGRVSSIISSSTAMASRESLVQ